MAEHKLVMIDGNAAAAHVAHATNEVIAIYPITPSSPMGELSDQFSSQGRPNVWGTIPEVVELQSEAGASGTVHGALTTGALTTTFTASQGLLLMIPNMFKISGELTSTVFHIAARAVAGQALSIFGDHSDVMATRSTGWAMLASNSVQEVMDNALIAQMATLKARIPFLHFFDGFRTSHEIQKVTEVPYEVMKELIDPDLVRAHRLRGLNPEHPSIRGTSQNPDVFFAARETVNRYYNATPGIVQEAMNAFAAATGRQYHLFDYVGAENPEHVTMLMGSGAETMEETVEHLVSKGEKVGMIKVRLFRPFDTAAFLAALPDSVRGIAVLDRTKEPGASGEPMYQDVRAAVGESGRSLEVIGGRYGLGSNEFTPAMCKSVFDNLAARSPRNHFTVGIRDDVTHTSLEWDPDFSTEADDVFRGLFYGLGSDGTVGANKNSIKIIGDNTDNFAQGYFVYDSKKAGATTVSHLRFGTRPIRSTYLISKARFLACHKFAFVEKLDMLSNLEAGGTFLLASPYPADTVWAQLPVQVQKQIIDRKIRFFVLDAVRIADEMGMGSRINVIMQTAFFKISGVLPEDQAVELIRNAIRKTYGKKGEEIVNRNIATIDKALESIAEVKVPAAPSGDRQMLPPVPADAPEFVRKVTGEIIAGRGHLLPVSALPDDGTYPTGTTKYEKRNIAEQIPVWDPEVCIQCGDCAAVCPHGTIRLKAYDDAALSGAPDTFKTTAANDRRLEGMKFTIQVAPEDCTGCGACVHICPAHRKVDGVKTEFKAINMEPQAPLREKEAENWDFFLKIPNTPREKLNIATTRGSQMLEPLFEFSGACAGCGETPYVKLLSQLYGDRAVIANATGCSSIYGGNLPTTPYTTRADGRGPVWSNSLFEDAAEFGFGMRLTSDKLADYARELVQAMITAQDPAVDAGVLRDILDNQQLEQEDIEKQRALVASLKEMLPKAKAAPAAELLSLADQLVRKSVWVLGGDGWAYDIGFGGVDHVLASGRNINMLVMDTEVYSNTGGQMSKATPIGAIAKFAAGGKPIRKKDLGMMAMSYGYVYVARIAMGYNRAQTLKAFLEAESYPGPSIIIAYSHCIAHGIDMAKGMSQQKSAVTSGLWPLYRYDPRLADEGKNPLQLDSREPKTPVADYVYNELRYRSLQQAKPEIAQNYLAQAEKQAREQYRYYKYLADMPGSADTADGPAAGEATEE